MGTVSRDFTRKELVGQVPTYLGGLDYSYAGGMIENILVSAALIEKMYLMAEQGIRMVGLDPKKFHWVTDQDQYMKYAADIDNVHYEVKVSVETNQDFFRIDAFMLKCIEEIDKWTPWSPASGSAL